MAVHPSMILPSSSVPHRSTKTETSSETTTTTKVLSQSSLSKLATSGSDIEVYGGWRYIHSKHYMSESSSSSDNIVAIPDELESVQTLKFLGFTENAADLTFKRFQRAQSKWQDEEIISYAKGTVRAGNDAVDDTDNWDEAMRSMGIDEQLRGRILDPRYANIRRTETAMHWVIDTITDLYEFLTSFNANMKRAEMLSGPLWNIVGKMTRGASPAASSTTLMVQPQSKTKEKGSKPQGGLESPVSTTIGERTVPADEERIVQADETTLLKGGSLSRLNGAINYRRENTPVVSLNEIPSVPPTDFSGDKLYWYFTKQKTVAELYANWASQRLGGERVEIGILTVIIPNILLENAVEIYSNTLKEFVWTNRLNLHMPDYLLHFAESEVLVGPIISAPTTRIARMFDRGEDWTNLEPLRLSSGDSATQWCIQSRELILEMNQRARCWVTRLESSVDE